MELKEIKANEENINRIRFADDITVCTGDRDDLQRSLVSLNQGSQEYNTRIQVYKRVRKRLKLFHVENRRWMQRLHLGNCSHKCDALVMEMNERSVLGLIYIAKATGNSLITKQIWCCKWCEREKTSKGMGENGGVNS
jgi:hypothetical protein